MKDLTIENKIKFENEIYTIRAIASMKAIDGNMYLECFKNLADYPTDQITFYYKDGEKILSKNLFQINQMIKKKVVTLIEKGETE